MDAYCPYPAPPRPRNRGLLIVTLVVAVSTALLVIHGAPPPPAPAEYRGEYRVVGHLDEPGKVADDAGRGQGINLARRPARPSVPASPILPEGRDD